MQSYSTSSSGLTVTSQAEENMEANLKRTKDRRKYYGHFTTLLHVNMIHLVTAESWPLAVFLWQCEFAVIPAKPPGEWI